MVSTVAKKRRVNANLSSVWTGLAPPSLSFGEIMSEILANMLSKSVTSILKISLNRNRSSILHSWMMLLN